MKNKSVMLLVLINIFLITFCFSISNNKKMSVDALPFLENDSSIREPGDDEENGSGVDYSYYQAYFGIFEDIINLSIPYQDGYEFIGWYTEDGVQVTDEYGKVINEDAITNNNSHTISGSGRLDVSIHLVGHFNKIEDVVDEEFEYNHESIKITDDRIIYEINPGIGKEELINKVTTNANVMFLDDKDIMLRDGEKIKTGDKLRATFSTRVVEYKLSVKGDVLGTGSLSVGNAKKIAKHVIDKDVLVGEEYLLAADYNSDGKIKMNDVVKILREIR